MDRGASSFLYFSQEPGHRPMACRALHHQAVIPDLVNCLNTSARVHQCTVKTSLPMPKKPAVVGLELSFSQTMMWFQWVERCEKCPALIRGVVPRAAACLDPMETVLHNVAHTRSRVSSVVADRRCVFQSVSSRLFFLTGVESFAKVKFVGAANLRTAPGLQNLSRPTSEPSGSRIQDGQVRVRHRIGPTHSNSSRTSAFPHHEIMTSRPSERVEMGITSH